MELHIHGGPAVIRAVLAAVPRCVTSHPHGDFYTKPVRYAEPGEFTRRAFHHGRLDLTQIEALGDTLNANTEQQRRLAIRGFNGSLASQYEAWRQDLVFARGELEALIDFSEDQHLDESPAFLTYSVASQVQGLVQQLKAFQANSVRGELLRNGIGLSLLGAPNAGKSSLLNRIVGREAAIVSAEAGTTRDVVEVGVDIGGWYCRLGDMAGIRQSQAANASPAIEALQTGAHLGYVEHEGIRRAKQRAFESDIVIVVCSVEPAKDGRDFQLRLEPEVLDTAAKINQQLGNVIVAVTKTDLVGESLSERLPKWIREIKISIPSLTEDSVFGISCISARSRPQATSDSGGIQAFQAGLVEKFRSITSPVTPGDIDGQSDIPSTDMSMWEESLGASERQRLLLDDCLSNLEGFLSEVAPTSDRTVGASPENLDVVVAAERLRMAADCLGKITGRGEAGDVEEVLGVVFEK